MTALPTERDLPPAVHDAVRSRLVEAVAAPPAARRPWIPAAAAAAVLVVAGAAAGVARVGGPDRPDSVAAAPTAAELLAACQTELDRLPSTPDAPGRVRLRALFQDRYGYVLAVGNARHDGYCELDPQGEPLGAGVSTPAGRRQPGLVLQVDGSGRSPLYPDREQPVSFVVEGLVGPQVARVVATWEGGGSVTAAVGDGRFIARLVSDEPVSGDGRPAVVAYDAGGGELLRGR